MAFLLGGANSPRGYDISNSCRFNDNDSAYLAITPDAGNRRTWTFSCWLKRGNISSYQRIFSAYATGDNEHLIFRDTDQLHFYSGDATIDVKTNAVFRDPSAFYHIVCSVDTTDGTAANRVKLYVNGVQETSFATATYPSADADTGYNENVAHDIGRSAADAQYFDGYMSDVYFIDGTQYAASDFGETDEDSGIWKPKAFSGTFGTNGFYLEFKETGTGTASASTIGADTSGNTNHLTSTNLAATDTATDSPTNNFCTMNPIAADPNTTLAEGNLKWTSGGEGGVVGTMAVSNGKWYWECKGVDVGADSQLGIWQTSKDTGYPLNQYVGTGESWGYVTFSGKNIHSDSQGGAITTVSDNDIMMFALDMDNYKLWFGINGTWTQSGNPATGANANHTGITDEFMTPAIASFSGTSGYDWQFNFGNPPFAISSGNADANGYGNFEHAPSSGFFALCTKNLAEYG